MTQPDAAPTPTGPPAADASRLVLVRHGQTEWAQLGRHTGRTDVPLDDDGRRQAEALGRQLAGRAFALVLSSPRSRALDTARLAGFGAQLRVDDDLREWDYGALEGRTTPEIRAELPDWSIWTGPWPGGETPEAVGERADRVIARCLEGAEGRGDALLFGHGHLLRVLAARWLGLEPTAGRFFLLGTATLSGLGWNREQAVIETWNAGPPTVL